MNPTLKRILQIAVIVFILLGAFAYRDPRAQATIGAGYAAHQLCSCVFVAERSYESCRPDLPLFMDQVQSEVVEQDGRSGVRGWVPFFSDRFAFHQPGLGCALD